MFACYDCISAKLRHQNSPNSVKQAMPMDDLQCTPACVQSSTVNFFTQALVAFRFRYLHQMPRWSPAGIPDQATGLQASGECFTAYSAICTGHSQGSLTPCTVLWTARPATYNYRCRPSTCLVPKLLTSACTLICTPLQFFDACSYFTNATAAGSLWHYMCTPHDLYILCTLLHAVLQYSS